MLKKNLCVRWLCIFGSTAAGTAASMRALHACARTRCSNTNGTVVAKN